MAKVALWVAILILCIITATTMRKNGKLNDELTLASQNQRGLTDTLRVVRNKAGNTEAVISSFATKLSDLEALDRSLYAESKKEIGQLKSIIKASINIKQDTLIISNTLDKIDGETYGLRFEKIVSADSFSSVLRGISKFKLIGGTITAGETVISENSTSFKLIMGFREEKDNYVIFARSPYSGLKIDSLSGALIIPKRGADPILGGPVKKKRFGIGPVVGYGMDYTGSMAPFLGFGFCYSLIRF